MTRSAPGEGRDDREEVRRLLINIRSALPRLRIVLEKCNSHWNYEDGVYRFYHQSLKVYGLQAMTKEMVSDLQALMPDRKLDAQFMKIIREGTGRTFQPEDNLKWMKVTRPILEAFFHARYFLEMAIRYGEGLKEPPLLLPSGWAGLLYLYDLR